MIFWSWCLWFRGPSLFWTLFFSTCQWEYDTQLHISHNKKAVAFSHRIVFTLTEAIVIVWSVQHRSLAHSRHFISWCRLALVMGWWFAVCTSSNPQFWRYARDIREWSFQKTNQTSERLLLYENLQKQPLSRTTSSGKLRSDEVSHFGKLLHLQTHRNTFIAAERGTE